MEINLLIRSQMMAGVLLLKCPVLAVLWALVCLN